LFNLQEWEFYLIPRLDKPEPLLVLQERIATLEGGVGAVCCSLACGHRSWRYFRLHGPGKNIIASTRLYGGTVTAGPGQTEFKRFGWVPASSWI